MYNFMIYNGMPGYVPNASCAYSVETIEEARTIIADEIARFCEGDYAENTSASFNPHGPNASVWSWTLARAVEGAEELTISGMTEAEYAEWESEE